MQKTVGIYDHDLQWEVFTELARKDIRFALCYFVSVETGLRISDVLSLERPVASNFAVLEQKTGKSKNIVLSDELFGMLSAYQSLVFPVKSWKVRGTAPSDRLLFPFSRSTFWRQMKAATESLGLKQVGVHGLRKTYG